MSFYNLLVEKVILPLSDLLLKKNISKQFLFLQESARWSESELEAFQNEKLQKLVLHAYKNVPYYRERFDRLKLKPTDVRSRADLHKIPILTKDDITKNFPHKIIYPSYPSNLIIPHKSSGSTGQPLQYYVSKDAYSFNIACNLRGWYWMGYRLGDKFIKISQYERTTEKQLQDLFLRTRYLSSADLSEKTFAKMIKFFETYEPDIIRCYPDPLYFIAKYMERNNISHIKPRVVTTTGNILTTEARKTIEQQFGCKVYDSYRCEGGPNAFEAPDDEVYISSMEYGITEIISNGEEVTPGERGRAITTDLHNYAMPFIRYDSQDILVKGKRKAKNGMQHLTIDRIEGREGDILITPNGQYLIIIHFVDYFDKFSTVRHFQVKQDSVDELVIFIKVEPNFSTNEYEEILNYWRSYVNNSMKIDLKVVDNILPSPSGKRRLLIRNKNIDIRL